MDPFTIAVFISGNGSNLQAIIDNIESGRLPIKIAFVLSNDPNAYGLTRAKNHNIPTHIINHKDYSDRELFDGAILKTLKKHPLDLIVLAGFMRILGKKIIDQYPNKIINIHPSLLPKYKGLHTHQQALDNGDTEHGSTVHFVTANLDDGPILGQARLTLRNSDTPDTLKTRIQQLEHSLYPTIIKWIAEETLTIQHDKLFLQGSPLSKQGYQLPMSDV